MSCMFTEFCTKHSSKIRNISLTAATKLEVQVQVAPQ
jgi:hypothetical protein